jgi:hypothetical protein
VRKLAVSYKVVWTRSAGRAAASWNLSDQAYVEMRLRVEMLSRNPADLLVRTNKPIDGLTYFVEFIDPTNRLCVHGFSFHVLYSQDEQTIYIVRATHFRQIG